ncbi:MotA/TolQ/ExbB proton channel family protein [Seohaeicola saemankumensis]|uniref:MotA/TolQ/ExbB proton channel family protein n=1 Tax=Seohaeicola saemankumensis TaxID=481181 RepID=UPI001E427360|nr:MotA/TolQ/ExbB proton channel family protein [Seohaeicola saemankumensis]
MIEMLHDLAVRLSALVELGGWVFALLLALSVVAGAVILWKAVHLRFLGLWRGARLHAALVPLASGQTVAAREALTRAGDPLARLALRAMAASVPTAALRERLHAETEVELARAESGLRFLDAVAQVAPLLGLFGTVLGMIEAFQALQGAGASVDPSLLAGGIWVALLTTAVGLAIAMPVSLILTAFEARIAAHRRLAETMVETLCGPALPHPELPDPLHHSGLRAAHG